MLIDWLTLRFPLSDMLGETLHARIRDALGRVVKVSADGQVVWEKMHIDFDAIRSDSLGLYWSITADGDAQRYLTIGASPASLLNQGVNVFGSLSVEEGAKVLVKTASLALESILPAWNQWQCRRLDITANYDMGSPAQVKQALRLLLATDAPRRRTNSDRKGGDTVYWNPSSALRSGKAYHKGAHLRMQQRKGNIAVDASLLDLADNLLRMELKLGSCWFRRFEAKGLDWKKLAPLRLTEIHHDFFDALIGGSDVEVNDMGTLLKELEKVCPTKGRALAAHRTFALMKVIGYTQTKESMPKATFYLHSGYLRAAGLSSADLCAGKVLELRKRSLVLAEPVTSWEQIRKAA